MIENRDDLSNGIALNSSMVHGSRIIGPAIAGILIYKIGEGYCFLLDGLSYLAVIAALLAMHVKPHLPPPVRRHPLHDFDEGLRYAFGSPPIRTLLLLVATVSLMGMAQSTLMPIVAGNILKGHARPSACCCAPAVAARFVGSIYLAARRTVVGLGRVIAAAVLILGLAIIAFSFFHPFVAVAAPAGGGGRNVADPKRFQQHHSANHRRRRQTRPHHEPLCRRLHWHGPLWRPLGRPRRHPPGRTAHPPSSAAWPA